MLLGSIWESATSLCMVYSYGSQILLDNVIITNNNNEEYYRCLFEKKPSLIINLKIINYANKNGRFYRIMSMNILSTAIIKFLLSA